MEILESFVMFGTCFVLNCPWICAAGCGAVKIWETAVLPALLNSADCWFDIPKAAMDKLDKLQNTFYQVLLKCPSTCPKPGWYWFTGGLLMSNRIIEKKLNFIFHVAHLSKDSLAFEVLESQRKLEIGMWKEVLQFLRELDIEVRKEHVGDRIHLLKKSYGTRKHN